MGLSKTLSPNGAYAQALEDLTQSKPRHHGNHANAFGAFGVDLGHADGCAKLVLDVVGYQAGRSHGIHVFHHHIGDETLLDAVCQGDAGIEDMDVDLDQCGTALHQRKVAVFDHPLADSRHIEGGAPDQELYVEAKTDGR